MLRLQAPGADVSQQKFGAEPDSCYICFKKNGLGKAFEHIQLQLHANYAVFSGLKGVEGKLYPPPIQLNAKPCLFAAILSVLQADKPSDL